MKTYGGSEVIASPFLTSELHGGDWPASRPSCFTSMDSTLGGPQSRYGRYVEEKTLPLTGIEPQ
jgi:hypothetical protein